MFATITKEATETQATNPREHARSWTGWLLSGAAILPLSCGGGGSSGGGPSSQAVENLELLFVSSHFVDLAWTDSAQGEDGFRILRADDVGGSPDAFVEVGEVPAETESFQDAGLLEATRYWYRIVAFDGGSESPPSNELLVETSDVASLPAAPALLQATPSSSSSIRLTWDDLASTEHGFLIERAPDVGGTPGPFTILVSVAASVEEHDDVGLAPATTAWYRVRAFEGLLTSGYSNQAVATTSPSVSPASRIDAITLAGDQGLARLLIEDDGRYFVSIVSSNLVLLAFSPDHTLLWQREYDALLASGHTRIHRSTDGDLWITSAAFFVSIVLKVRASDGSVVWANLYETTLPEEVFEGGPHSPPLASIALGNGVVGRVQHDGTIPWAWGVGGTEQRTLSDGSRVAWGGPLLAKIRADGTKAWERVFVDQDPIANEPIVLQSVHECADQGLLVFGSMGAAFWTAKLGPTGALVSQKTLSAPGTSAIAAIRTTEEPTGGLLVASQTSPPIVFRFDDLGLSTWAARVDTPGQESVEHVLPRESGGCLLVGTTTFAGGGIWIVALDGTGTIEWERILQSSQSLLVSVSAFVTPDDGVVVAGNNLFQGPWTAKLDAQGILTTQRRWTGTIGLLLHHVDLLPDGRRVLVGADLGSDLWTAVLDPLGELIESTRVHETGIDVGSEDTIAVGLQSDGQLAFAFTSLHASSPTTDVSRALLEVASPESSGSGQSACASQAGYSSSGLLALPGVAVGGDPTIDVTDEVFSIALDANLVVPGVIPAESFGVSLFQGTTVLVERCSR